MHLRAALSIVAAAALASGAQCSAFAGLGSSSGDDPSGSSTVDAGANADGSVADDAQASNDDATSNDDSAADECAALQIDAGSCAGAIYVNGAAASSGNGSRASPFKTISAALATPAPRIIVVCNGSYAEPIAVKDGPTTIVGAYDCATWTPSATRGTHVQAPAGSGATVTIAKVASGVFLSRMTIAGPTTTATARSSVGIFATASTATLDSLVVTSTNALGGANGETTFNYAGMSALAGNALGTGSTCTCTNGTSSTGGSAGSEPGNVQPLPGTSSPATANASQNAGVTSGVCGPGSLGSDGLSPTVFQTGASAGILTPTGWQVGQGVDGVDGFPAQGGGGGGAGMGSAGKYAGGSGGCGGCGGGKGTGGQSGGSSFGIISSQSTLTMKACTVTPGDGANGGIGGDAQVGQLGGTGYDPMGGDLQCAGGHGGNGGNGVGATGGVGGHSVGIGYQGTMPTYASDSTIAHGSAGSGGFNGGVAGVASGNGSAASGVAAATLQL